MSETIVDDSARKAFYKAMAAAQAKIEGASKDKSNPHFQSKYADLGSAWDACREPLTSNGLAVMQFPDYDPATKCVTVETIITHSEGHEKSFSLNVPVSKLDAQGIGSAITYGRRYALMAAVGIAPEDDDGNAAVAQNNSHTAKPARTVGERAPGKPTASAAKPAWNAFLTKLQSFTDPEECNTWFDSQEVQDRINSWPKGDSGDWAELAGEEFDKHLKALWGAKGDAAQ